MNTTCQWSGLLVKSKHGVLGWIIHAFLSYVLSTKITLKVVCEFCHCTCVRCQLRTHFVHVSLEKNRDRIDVKNASNSSNFLHVRIVFWSYRYICEKLWSEFKGNSSIEDLRILYNGQKMTKVHQIVISIQIFRYNSDHCKKKYKD